MKPTTFGLLIDLKRCSGCGKCARACATAHGRAAPAEVPTSLSARDLTSLRRSSGAWVRNLCRHCNEPACASACIVGAIAKDRQGPVTWDEDKCIGCRYCMLACPFNVPKYEYDSPNPRVRKCDLCIDRIREGKTPACAHACYRGATMFGPRDEMLALARRRIERDPEGYEDHVYGETEAGGSAVMFIAPWPIAALGYVPELGTVPLPDLTSKALARVPTIAVCGAVGLSALYWLIRRRDEVASTRAAAVRAARDRLHADGGPGPREVTRESV